MNGGDVNGMFQAANAFAELQRDLAVTTRLLPPVLAALLEDPQLNVEGIARQVGAEVSVVRGTLMALEERGLTISTRYQLTAAGREALGT